MHRRFLFLWVFLAGCAGSDVEVQGGVPGLLTVSASSAEEPEPLEPEPPPTQQADAEDSAIAINIGDHSEVGDITTAETNALDIATEALAILERVIERVLPATTSIPDTGEAVPEELKTPTDPVEESSAQSAPPEPEPIVITPDPIPEVEISQPEEITGRLTAVPNDVRESEGFVPVRYCDGDYVAIGYGHLVIDPETGERLLCSDWELALYNAEQISGERRWGQLDVVRQSVLAEIAYMTGAEGFAAFTDLRLALWLEDWYAAAAAVRDSLLGCPADMEEELCKSRPNNRRERLAELVLVGEAALNPG